MSLRTSRAVPFLLASLAIIICVSSAVAQERASKSGQPEAAERQTRVAADTIKVALTVTVSSRQIQIAEPFRLRVDCKVGEDVVIKFPELGKRWGRFDVVGQSDRWDIPEPDGDRRWSRELVLETLETGDLQTPSLEIIATRGESSRRLSAAPQRLTVASVLEPNADITKIRDIKPLLESEQAEESATRSWWMASAALAIAVCGALLWRRRGESLTPREWALRELEKLTVDEDAAGAVFESLTSIVARYLHWQFELDTPSWTTPELLLSPQIRRHLNDSDISQAESLLELADRVKYAAAQPTPAESLDAIQRCRQFVERLDAERFREEPASNAPLETRPESSHP